MTVTVSHDALLERADLVRSAAWDHDVDRLQREVGALLDSFVAHIEQERQHVRQLPTFSARLVERGQERLLAGLLALVVEAECEDTSWCARLCDDVMVQLAAQAEAEGRSFSRAGCAMDLSSGR